jgi:hypothetical protein
LIPAEEITDAAGKGAAAPDPGQADRGLIFFTGEAVSVGQHSSLPGALITGLKAAEAATVAVLQSSIATESMTTG